MKNNEDKKLHHGSRATMWILLSLIILVVCGLFIITPYMVKGSENDVTIRIPKDADMNTVSDTLNKYFDKDYSDKVLNLMGMAGFDPKERHGSYHLPKGATPFATMRKLTRGAQTPVRLTINGFRSLPYLAERIALKMEFSKEDLLKALKNPEFLAQYGLTTDQALSLFLEDTYEVYWTASPQEVLTKIGDNYLAYWSPGRKAVVEDMDLTPAEMMTLASIVDEETNQDVEKGRIGRLYLNRLDNGMKLQADPTIRYALDDFTIRRVTLDHLKVDSPYNTYMHQGLPPGPIRTTSRKTLDLILQSKPSTDLFMCAREDFSGFHNFAPTFEEHQENARLYQKALDERGIQ